MYSDAQSAFVVSQTVCARLCPVCQRHHVAASAGTYSCPCGRFTLQVARAQLRLAVGVLMLAGWRSGSARDVARSAGQKPRRPSCALPGNVLRSNSPAAHHRLLALSNAGCRPGNRVGVSPCVNIHMVVFIGTGLVCATRWTASCDTVCGFVSRGTRRCRSAARYCSSGSVVLVSSNRDPTNVSRSPRQVASVTLVHEGGGPEHSHQRRR